MKLVLAVQNTKQMLQISQTWRNPLAGWLRVDTSMVHPRVGAASQRERKRLKRSDHTIVYPRRVPLTSTGLAKGRVPDISPLSRLAGYGMGENRDIPQRFA